MCFIKPSYRAGMSCSVPSGTTNSSEAEGDETERVTRGHYWRVGVVLTKRRTPHGGM